MKLEEKAEEILETAWIAEEEKQEDFPTADGLGKPEKEALEQLLKAGYITLADGRLKLTDQGRPVARNVVRRHRLAERLLIDVLGTGSTLLDERACRFEHLLDRGLEESVCSLLGHPKICPHGKTIPPGRCCQQGRAPASKLVFPLSQMNLGQTGKVAYVYAPESSQLQKLMAMGILPGVLVNLIQNFPSYVFKIGETQFAVDKDIATTIYLRIVEPEEVGEVGAEPAPKRGWRWGLRRHFGRQSRR